MAIAQSLTLRELIGDKKVNPHSECDMLRAIEPYQIQRRRIVPICNTQPYASENLITHYYIFSITICFQRVFFYLPTNILQIIHRLRC